MISIDEKFLASLSSETRQMLDSARVSTIVLSLVPVEAGMPASASRFGGQPGVDRIDWPVDKNRKPMQFWAQINFQELPAAENCPRTGVLMLFISADYQLFRPKDQTWYRLIYCHDVASAHPVGQNFPQFGLVAERHEYTDCHGVLKRLVQLRSEERASVESWLKVDGRRSKEELADKHQITGIRSQSAEEAEMMAAFHANGITFDQTRRTDPHYSHLLEAACQWVIFWRLSGIAKVFPQERRELFIALRLADLIKSDFSKCSPVFL